MASGFRVPEKPLPYPPQHDGAAAYVEALLHFMSSSQTLQTLCGGVHILDFFTREQDLYSSVLPLSWRDWLGSLEISDLLDLLMREDIDPLLAYQKEASLIGDELSVGKSKDHNIRTWRGKALPPLDFLEYIHAVRSLSLEREMVPYSEAPSKEISRHLSVGMKTKKLHEVESFATFIDLLDTHITQTSNHDISHIVDFGSGQNYLGRVLASSLYRRRVIAVESKPLNIDGAKLMDVSAKLAQKPVIWRNKKAFRSTGTDNTATPETASIDNVDSTKQHHEALPKRRKENDTDKESSKQGCIQYVEHRIEDGHLDPVIEQVKWNHIDQKDIDTSDNTCRVDHVASPQLMVVSLHSCGNLLHHGLRSLILNPHVKAVAMIGCCYNLATERLGPATYKLPSLRAQNLRLDKTSKTSDPHGFPMSERMCTYQHKNGPGIRWNITARMMAVQAPQNWTQSDCDSFFTRHFYRAVLQRIFLDRGVVERPKSTEGSESLLECGPAVIIGSLRKACYDSFVAYVRGALEKLKRDPNLGPIMNKHMTGITDTEIAEYEQKFQCRKHELCIIWSLMAFSAGVVEAAFVTDRWLWLTEQPQVKQCWVQTVFEYSQSPRNLVVVGVKE